MSERERGLTLATGRGEWSGHIDELDGLRAIAVGLVMLRHLTDPVPPTAAGWLLGSLAFGGSIGVDLFFVLSGFLITGICLDHRGPGFLRAFYLRRALRIVPPYFALLAVLAITGVNGLGWLATFTTNIRLAVVGNWSAVPATATHLWSLGVEEQFYLVWPALVVALSTRGARQALLGAALLALCFRAGLMYGLTPPHPVAAAVLMPTRMDALSTGSLLAMLIRGDHWAGIARPLSRLGDLPVRWWGLVLALLLWQTLAVSLYFGERAAVTFQISVTALASGLALASVLASRANAPIRGLLASAPMRAIGRRSYALYLWHLPINVWLRGAWTPARTMLGLSEYVLAACAMSWAAATASWYIVERPALSLKSAVPYDRPATNVLVDTSEQVVENMDGGF